MSDATDRDPRAGAPPTCRVVREAVSATLDGEQPPPAATDVQRHVAACEDCATWTRSVGDLHAATRVTSAPRIPDLRHRVVAAAAAVPATSATGRGIGPARRRDARLVLAMAGLVQVAVAVVGLLGPVPMHAVREVAAFEVALGVAMAAAAWRPARFARGVLPMLVTAAVVVVGAAVVDVAGGVTSPAGEFSHLVPAIGAAVLWWLTGTTDAGSRLHRGWT